MNKQMELAAMHMKRNGSYLCRALSFEHCTFEIIEDAFTQNMVDTYDRAARLWQEMSVALSEGYQNV